MSEVETVVERVRAVAFQAGIGTLAKEAGIDADHARRFLKRLPKQIDTLVALELAADRLRQAEPSKI